ncbi:MAG: hypothetical protein JOZ96_29230 [Acidobacteria bacterium]|nr:hypothetical protein [Acidobacteriota bacterium]
MKRWIGYDDSVTEVLRALGRLRMKGTCPTLFCIPDVLVHRERQEDAAEEGERVEVARASKGLDGHACISALTAAHLCLGLASEYNVLLVVKAGDQGAGLLEDVGREFRRRGCNMFRYLAARGKDREIRTRESGKVNRKIDKAEKANQLLWEDVDSLHCTRWLGAKGYGLVVGDPESYLVRSDKPERLRALISDAAVAVIDTLAWKKRVDAAPAAGRPRSARRGRPTAGKKSAKWIDDDERNKKIWNTVQSLVRGETFTFVSVSDEDAVPLAVAAGLQVDAAAPVGSACEGLSRSLGAGFLVLHGKDANVIYSCRDGRVRAHIPACDITPRKTNGAGDTFNGALALASTAMLFESASGEAGAEAGEDVLRHILAFATAAVSLRLKNGRYATRADLLLDAKDLRPKGGLAPEEVVPPREGEGAAVGADGESQGQWLAHVLARFWDDVPKLALVDLDHTLCDSRKWRLAAAGAGFKALGILGDDAERQQLYENIYRDHDNWQLIIDTNVRYKWKSRELFELALALNELLTPGTYEERREEWFRDSRDVQRELLKVRNDPSKNERVDRAVEAFKSTPAFPYPDSVAGLYQLRDVLGFKLKIVTEGDFETQCWKLKKLGLKDMFPRQRDIVYTEDAYASKEQLDHAVRVAINNGEDEKLLTSAQRICARYFEKSKASFRAEAFRDVLEKSGAERIGVHTCTVGDRIDTDVASYLDIRRRQLSQEGGAYGGLVVGRLRRGVYYDQLPSGADDEPDFTVYSLPEFAAKLSDPGFWHGEPTIRRIESIGLPRLSDADRELLRMVRSRTKSVELAAIIDRILRTEN